MRRGLFKSDYISEIQSNPTVMDLKELKFFSVIGGLLLLPIYEIKKSSFMGQKIISILAQHTGLGLAESLKAQLRK